MSAALLQEPEAPSAVRAADVPLYTLADAARYLRVPVGRVRKRFSGRSLVRAAGRGVTALSFRNVLEFHLLEYVRRQRPDPAALRAALVHFAGAWATPHPLAHAAAGADRGAAIVGRYVREAGVPPETAAGLAAALRAAWDRIACDPTGEPVRFYPTTRPPEEPSPCCVVLDPVRRAGRPCLAGTHLVTAIVAGRFVAGDSVADIAEDYDRTPLEIEEAVRYECRARA